MDLQNISRVHVLAHLKQSMKTKLRSLRKIKCEALDKRQMILLKLLFKVKQDDVSPVQCFKWESTSKKIEVAEIFLVSV